MNFIATPTFSPAAFSKKNPVANRENIVLGMVLPRYILAKKGFTMVELIVVIAIIVILTSIAAYSLSGTQDSSNMTRATQTIQGILEQARTLAMSSKTYAWVGFFEESSTSPGTAGTGQVVMMIVESADGSKLYTSSSTTLPAASLVQAIQLVKIPNLHLEVLGATPTRTTIPSNTYQVASTSFANGINFVFSGTSTYTFTNIIQFSPQGDATRINDTPTQYMEIGMCPAHGNVVVSSSKDIAAIQIAGIGGHVTLYRP